MTNYKMDLYITYRYLTTLLIWIMYAAEVKTHGSPRWLRNLVHSTRLSRTKRFDLAKSEQQMPEKYLKKCCQNNGLCVLGSFCQCKKEYFGRYCQYEVRRSNCGPVKHKQWFQSTCSLCSCFNGKSYCYEGAFGDCDPKVYTKGYNPADPANIVEIFPLGKGEDHLENSWADTETSSSGQHRPLLLVVFLLAIILSTGVA